MKHIFCLLAALFFGTLAAPLVQAAPIPLTLPVGDWSVNVNGFHGTLHISAINPDGRILAGSSIFGDRIIGFYDSTSARINFIRVSNADPTFQQVYNGYLFKDIPNPSLFVLTGEFSAYENAGGVAAKFDLGWFASKRVP